METKIKISFRTGHRAAEEHSSMVEISDRQSSTGTSRL